MSELAAELEETQNSYIASLLKTSESELLRIQRRGSRSPEGLQTLDFWLWVAGEAQPASLRAPWVPGSA